jgi:inorganic triphosphatase YgiF
MAIETELKLTLPATKNAVFKRLLAAHAAAVHPPEVKQLLSIYFDTPALDLARRDMALRLRCVDGEWLQTLKLGEQAGAGLHQRPELEITVGGQALELARISNRKARQFLTQEHIVTALMPLFSTDISRTQWLLHDMHDNAMEIALDRGWIICGNHKQKLNEVEFELKQGDAAALFELALDLSSTLALIPEAQSKAARGYALYPATPPLTPTKAQLPALQPQQTPTTALRAIVLETLRHFQSNAAGITRRDNIEFIHQMRVALRRLRSAVTAFSNITGDEFWQMIDTETRWLAGLLGDVRDIDVLLTETLPALELPATNNALLRALNRTFQQQRKSNYKTLLDALGSARYGTLLLRLLHWLNMDTVAQVSKNKSLKKFSKRGLTKRRHQVERIAKHWHTLDGDERHTLRKRAKKLRYAIEFFSGLYKTKLVERYLNKLQAAQQLLGTANDAIAGQLLLKKLTVHDTALTPLAELISGELARTQEHADTELEQVITALDKAKPFW